MHGPSEATIEIGGGRGADNLIRWQAAFLFLATLALYFFTRSPVLDEWDSVQFALGVREFNLWKDQPHAPGYPLYVFLGWCGRALWGWDPALSLHLLSCLGGALFVTAWFLIGRLHFGASFGWLLAGTLIVTPTIWMTSTQVLTDMPAAGVLSAQLFCALCFREGGRRLDLLGAAALGAVVTGLRPQLFAVVVMILVTVLRQRRAPAPAWWLALGLLVAGCLCWLLPTFYLQAQVSPGYSFWRAYPAQLYRQWSWRLDKPHAYIGASDFSPRYFGLRFVTHILAWFGVGFGFLRLGAWTLVPGALLGFTGVIAYLKKFPSGDGDFWRTHRAWALLHIAIIFCFLPANQRYYLIIYPLVLTALWRGFLQLRGQGRGAGGLFFALLLFSSTTLALKNHSEDPPPMKLVRYLQDRHAPAQRAQVVLVLRECERHVRWYAPEFSFFDVRSMPFAKVDPAQLASAIAIYTDDAGILLPPGWRLIPLVQFHRSLLIELKQRDVALFQIEPILLP